MEWDTWLLAKEETEEQRLAFSQAGAETENWTLLKLCGTALRAHGFPFTCFGQGSIASGGGFTVNGAQNK